LSLIKICGLRREIDIEYANELRPDFIGFVFAESARMVSKSHALILKSRLDPSIKSVGVFVNADLYEILDICQRGIIDMIQLHGDENRDYILKLRTLTSHPIIKSFHIEASVQQSGITRYAAESEDCKARSGSHEADFLLFDTFHNRLRGGSGLSFDWSLIGDVDKPFFLAGGLNIDNITEAINIIKPYAVDVSSGVETDGYKDFHKMSLLVNKVRGGNANDQ